MVYRTVVRLHDLALMVAFFGLMTAIEVVYLFQVAGPESVNLIAAAEGIPTD
jgi:hypothetical protein